MTRRAALAAGIDAAAIIAFVAMGRGSHDEGSALGGTLEVAAPFLIAAAVGWLLARAWRRPVQPRTGVVVWLTTVALGMLLRRTAFDRGTAVSFVIVATIVLGAFLVGWRACIDQLWRRGRAPERPDPDRRSVERVSEGS